LRATDNGERITINTFSGFNNLPFLPTSLRGSQVWVASSDDVLGVATEGSTIGGLIEKLKVMIPELLEANGEPAEAQVPFEVLPRCPI